MLDELMVTVYVIWVPRLSDIYKAFLCILIEHEHVH